MSLLERAAAEPEIVLDLSRLMKRILRTTPTGVDRVELRYALTLLERIPHRLAFGGRFPYGIYGRLDVHAVRRFLAYTAAMWCDGSRSSLTRKRAATAHLTALRPRRIPPPRGKRVFLQVSPHHLERGERTARILRAEQALFVPMVHDLIPITHPEYQRPKGAAEHRQRIAVIMRHAAGIIANSAATRDALLTLSQGGWAPPIAVAHLGAELGEANGGAKEAAEPYFICIATIEPRKNHLLLLNVWKRLAEAGAAPALHLVGKRGWENEQVVDMLDRCSALEGLVFEHPEMSDREMQRLLHGARALLLPSFAEGFGMPVAEALHARVPVIAADIPALREVGQGVPDYLDPLDGPAWQAAIADYAQPGSQRRATQCARFAGWRAFTWDEHIDRALALIDSL